MKISATLTIVVLLIFATSGYAWWHGGVKDYDTGSNVPYADIYTNPPGGSTTSDGAGSFWLMVANGMEDGEYYSWVGASKGLKNGRNYVERYYYEDTNWGTFYIYIRIPNK